MLPTVWSGGTFVLQPKFSASRFWDLSLKYALTWLSIIPFASKAILINPCRIILIGFGVWVRRLNRWRSISR